MFLIVKCCVKAVRCNANRSFVVETTSLGKILQKCHNFRKVQLGTSFDWLPEKNRFALGRAGILGTFESIYLLVIFSRELKKNRKNLKDLKDRSSQQGYIGDCHWLCFADIAETKPHGQESLKMQNVEFDVTVPPCKLYL